VAGEHIMIVDDEPGVRSALEAILVDEGFSVTCADSGEAALEAIQGASFEAILLDVWLPGIDGIETLQRLRERCPSTEVVMISGHGTIETAVKATKLGAFDFVEKPLSLEKILVVLRNALRQRSLEQANRGLLAQLVRDTEIVGNSAPALRLRAEVEIAAESYAPVLILGHQGSDRELVARRIHILGERGVAPFAVVPCGALDSLAAEAALFGDGDRPGRLQLAAGGSLYLEEVDRLPADLQTRLAEALDTQAGQSPGVRPLTSLAGELSALEDGLRRVVDVIRVEVPRLVDRRDDIPMLAEQRMRDLAREYGREPKQLSPAVIAMLQEFAWPGELGELRHLLERLWLSSKSSVVEVADLPKDLGNHQPVVAPLYQNFSNLGAAVEAFTHHYVNRIVQDEGGDRPAALRRLDLSPEELDGYLKP
jgi:two-component system nitrogen regulation response regulator NtrX